MAVPKKEMDYKVETHITVCYIIVFWFLILDFYREKLDKNNRKLGPNH